MAEIAPAGAGNAQPDLKGIREASSSSKGSHSHAWRQLVIRGCRKWPAVGLSCIVVKPLRGVCEFHAWSSIMKSPEQLFVQAVLCQVSLCDPLCDKRACRRPELEFQGKKFQPTRNTRQRQIRFQVQGGGHARAKNSFLAVAAPGLDATSMSNSSRDYLVLQERDIKNVAAQPCCQYNHALLFCRRRALRQART